MTVHAGPGTHAVSGSLARTRIETMTDPDLKRATLALEALDLASAEGWAGVRALIRARDRLAPGVVQAEAAAQQLQRLGVGDLVQ